MTSMEKEWPVRMFRWTVARQWEQVQAMLAQDTKMSTPHPTQQQPQQQQQQQQQQKCAVIKITARHGCLILRRLKLKIKMTPQDTFMSRRHNRLMVQSRKSIATRVIVFQFRSEHECMAFCDFWMQLNPVQALPAPDPQLQVAARQDISLYLSQLLLVEPEFANFVARLDSFLSQSEEGEKMLGAFIDSMSSITRCGGGPGVTDDDPIKQDK